MALKRAGVPFESYRVVEFDKFAVRSYNAVHGTDFPPLDITKISAEDLGIVETDKYTYLMTYSFPCTDLSLAGKQLGMSKDSGTRSGLLWEVERLLNECEELPQFLLMENVPQVHGAANVEDFYKWIAFLSEKGYKSKYKDLNAANYGVPQSRERCFMVSYLDKKTRFEFPLPIKLERRLKDILEDDNAVDRKYYLSEQRVNSLLKHKARNEDNNNGYGARFVTENDIASSLTTSPDKSAGQYLEVKRGYKEGEALVAEIRVDEGIRTFINNLCGTLRTTDSGGDKVIIKNEEIRKLTPLECFRLMGVSDEDAFKMLSVNSDNQCYKQAGNSIVVDVMIGIFKNLFLGGSENMPYQMDIDDFL